MKILFKLDSEFDEDEKVEVVEIDEGNSIQDLIQLIVKNKDLQIKIDELTIVYGGTYLSSRLLISNARIEARGILEVRRAPKMVEKFGLDTTAVCDMGSVGKAMQINAGIGKGLEGTKFHDPKRGLKAGKFSSQGPDHRTWESGMHMECVCEEEGCEWKDKVQVVCLGFGSFDIVIIYGRKCYCGKCEAKIKPEKIRRAGFCNCKYKYDFIMSDFSDFTSEWIDVPDLPHWMKGEVDDNDAIAFKKLTFEVKERNK